MSASERLSPRWQLLLAVQQSAMTDNADTPADALNGWISVSNSLCAIGIVHDMQCHGRCGDCSIGYDNLQRSSKVLSQHESTERYLCARMTACQVRK